MGICLQQSPWAKGYFFLQSHHALPQLNSFSVWTCFFIVNISTYSSVMLIVQAKLTEGLSLAKEFHSNVQELLTKMSKCEESIGLLPSPSFVLDTVCTQLQDHRVCLFIPAGFFLSFFFLPIQDKHAFVSICFWFTDVRFTFFLQTLVNEVNGYCEKKTIVENTGCRLTELSRKEDCDVIHNLIMTVQDRYKKLQQRTSERGRMLEEVKKNARQVNRFITLTVNGWHSLSCSNYMWTQAVWMCNICIYLSYFSSVNLGASWWTGWLK